MSSLWPLTWRGIWKKIVWTSLSVGNQIFQGHSASANYFGYTLEDRNTESSFKVLRDTPWWKARILRFLMMGRPLDAISFLHPRPPQGWSKLRSRNQKYSILKTSEVTKCFASMLLILKAIRHLLSYLVTGNMLVPAGVGFCQIHANGQHPKGS